MEVIANILIMSGFMGFVLGAGIVLVSLVSSVFRSMGFRAFDPMLRRRIFSQKKKLILFTVASFLLMGLGVELLPDEDISFQEETGSIIKESKLR